MQTATVNRHSIISKSVSLPNLNSSEQDIISYFTSLIRKGNAESLYRLALKEARESWSEDTYNSSLEAKYMLHKLLGKTNQIMAQAIRQSVQCSRFDNCRSEQLDVRTLYSRKNGLHTMVIQCPCCGMRDRIGEEETQVVTICNPAGRDTD